jgi:hypothetical protein
MCDKCGDGTHTTSSAVLKEPQPIITGVERALVREHAEPRQLAGADEPIKVGREPLKPHLHLQSVHLNSIKDVNAKIGVGILKRVVINTIPTAAGAVLTILDGQQGGGSVLAVITLTGVAAGPPLSLLYDMPFTKGLFLSLVGAGAAASDWTVVFE